MKNLLYFTTIILVMVWVVAFFGFSVGYFIHWLLVLAVITLLLGLINDKYSKK